MTGLYIHIPFCKRKCPYCDFYSIVENDETIFHRYVKTLLLEADKYKDKRIEIDTVYLGGGTPSLMDEKLILTLLNGINERFKVCDNVEITIEANPSSVDFSKLSGYRKAGINRISFGIQSSSDRELKALGRLHNFDEAKKAVFYARQAGFENISADIMIALMGQTKSDVKKSVEDIVELGTTHISSYILKVEDNTPYAEMNLTLPDDDDTAEMYLYMSDMLKGFGYQHYEISNFSRPGYESRHNLKYWRAEEYIGLGVSAHSYFNGSRYYNKRNLTAYLNGESVKVIEEKNINKSEEYLMLSLRLSEGISTDKYILLGGNAEILDKAREIGNRFIKINGERLSLTEEGFLVSNEIISRLL